MPQYRLQNYLKGNRRRLRLSQAEIAFLTGVRSGAKICRNEHAHRKPSLEVALVYEIIFRKPVSELFRGMYGKLQNDVLSRASCLIRRLRVSGRSSRAARKVDVLERLRRQIMSELE